MRLSEWEQNEMSTQEDKVECGAEARIIKNKNVERLKGTRGGNRAEITRFEREATLIIQDHGDTLITDILEKLDSILSVLQEQWRLLCNLNDEILPKSYIGEIEKEICNPQLLRNLRISRDRYKDCHRGSGLQKGYFSWSFTQAS